MPRHLRKINNSGVIWNTQKSSHIADGSWFASLHQSLREFEGEIGKSFPKLVRRAWTGVGRHGDDIEGPDTTHTGSTSNPDSGGTTSESPTGGDNSEGGFGGDNQETEGGFGSTNNDEKNSNSDPDRDDEQSSITNGPKSRPKLSAPPHNKPGSPTCNTKRSLIERAECSFPNGQPQQWNYDGKDEKLLSQAEAPRRDGRPRTNAELEAASRNAPQTPRQPMLSQAQQKFRLDNYYHLRRDPAYGKLDSEETHYNPNTGVGFVEDGEYDTAYLLEGDYLKIGSDLSGRDRTIDPDDYDWTGQYSLYSKINNEGVVDEAGNALTWTTLPTFKGKIGIGEDGSLVVVLQRVFAENDGNRFKQVEDGEPDNINGRPVKLDDPSVAQQQALYGDQILEQIIRRAYADKGVTDERIMQKGMQEMTMVQTAIVNRETKALFLRTAKELGVSRNAQIHLDTVNDVGRLILLEQTDNYRLEINLLKNNPRVFEKNDQPTMMSDTWLYPPKRSDSSTSSEESETEKEEHDATAILAFTRFPSGHTPPSGEKRRAI
ncbi:MAG: hypothetical protein Q9227_008850 [Pyrenula ochraceoflavens]